MDIFVDFLEQVKEVVPAWVGLCVIPAALVLITVVLWLINGKSAFWGVAAILGGAGFFVVTLHTQTTVALCYLALYLVLSGVLRVIVCIPSPVGAKKGGSRDERIYKKFYEPLKTEPATQTTKPPKVVCYEQAPATPATTTAADSGMSLGYVSGLISRLKSEQLSPTDRLETEVLERTVEGYKNRELTEEELGVLNDCLATILKLTAKYKL